MRIQKFYNVNCRCLKNYRIKSITNCTKKCNNFQEFNRGWKWKMNKLLAQIGVDVMKKNYPTKRQKLSWVLDKCFSGQFNVCESSWRLLEFLSFLHGCRLSGVTLKNFWSFFLSISGMEKVVGKINNWSSSHKIQSDNFSITLRPEYFYNKKLAWTSLCTLTKMMIKE